MRVFVGLFMLAALTGLFMLVALTGPAAAASPTQAPMTNTHRYVSQRPEKAYLREGPSFDHKVLWVYRHRGYPFLVTARFDIWRRVQAMDGTTGWMSHAMLSDNRTVLVTGKGRLSIRQSGAPDAKVVGLADSGAILGVKACEKHACRVYAHGIDGWVDKDRIWGVEPGEVFKK